MGEGVVTVLDAMIKDFAASTRSDAAEDDEKDQGGRGA